MTIFRIVFRYDDGASLLIQSLATKYIEKGQIVNMIGIMLLTAIFIIPMGYFIEKARITNIKVVPASASLQALSDSITNSLRINPIKVSIEKDYFHNLAFAICPTDKTQCRIGIGEELAAQMPESSSAIKGIIAHEIGHIVEQQTSRPLRLALNLMAINVVLWAYVYLMGWRYAFLLFSLVTVPMFLHDIISAETSHIGFTTLALIILLGYGAIVWPVELRTKLKIIFATVLVASLTHQIIKYPLRQDEANADMFALKNVGESSATQMLCLMRDMEKKEGSKSLLKQYFEWLDTHPSLDERFANLKLSSKTCL